MEGQLEAINSMRGLDSIEKLPTDTRSGMRFATKDPAGSGYMRALWRSKCAPFES